MRLTFRTAGESHGKALVALVEGVPAGLPIDAAAVDVQAALFRSLRALPVEMTSPRDAIILALSLEASFGDCSEQIQIGVPYYTIEPIVKQMQARRHKDNAVSTVEKRAAWQPSYDRITMPVRAEWSALELSLREVASLRVGDVIELPHTICNETRVLLNGTAKFVGTVGLDTDHVAVQLSRKLPNEDSSHGKPDGRKVP